MDILGTVEQALAGGRSDDVGAAVSDHVASMDSGEVAQHLQSAADNAAANGQPDVAREIADIASRGQTDPESLKTAAIDYVKSNPQILAHFAPAFAQGILSKL